MGDNFPAGAASGLGSMPGTDIVEELKFVLGELPDLPFLPELPARGPGADMLGRSAGLLADLPVELYTGRWRVAAHPGSDLRRTLDLWERDLDALTDAAAGFTGVLKLSCAGPWTLAASLELPIGGAVLHDHGAARDLAQSLADGLRAHVADVQARVPGASVVVQLDEPSLPAVLAAKVPTESGLRTLRAVATDRARDALSTVIEAAGVPAVVHCCAPDVPVALLRSAGAVGVSLDLSLLTTAGLDAIGELIDAGQTLFAGAVPAVGDRPPASASVAATVTKLWQRLGFPAELLPERVVVTPTCGLAGATPAYARRALTTCAEAARRLSER